MLDISHFYVEKKDYERGNKHCPAKEKKHVPEALE